MFFSKKILPIKYSYKQRIVFVHDVAYYANRYASEGWEVFSTQLLSNFAPSEDFWHSYSEDFPNRGFLLTKPPHETDPEALINNGKGMHRVLSKQSGTDEAVLLLMRKIELTP